MVLTVHSNVFVIQGALVLLTLHNTTDIYSEYFYHADSRPSCTCRNLELQIWQAKIGNDGFHVTAFRQRRAREQAPSTSRTISNFYFLQTKYSGATGSVPGLLLQTFWSDQIKCVNRMYKTKQGLSGLWE